MIDEGKSTQLSPIYVWAIAEEYFSINQTCQVLCTADLGRYVLVPEPVLKRYHIHDSSVSFNLLHGLKQYSELFIVEIICRDYLRCYVDRFPVKKHGSHNGLLSFQAVWRHSFENGFFLHITVPLLVP